MTFFLAMACALVAFGPYMAAYQFSGVADYRPRFRSLVYRFIGVAFVKLLLMATVLPSPSVSGSSSAQFHVVSCLISTLDIIGLMLSQDSLPKDFYSRSIAGGIAWGVADSAFALVGPLLFGARASALHLDPAYLALAADAAVSLPRFIALAALVATIADARRSPSSRSAMPAAVAAVAIASRFDNVVAAMSDADYGFVLVHLTAAILAAVVSYVVVKSVRAQPAQPRREETRSKNKKAH